MIQVEINGKLLTFATLREVFDYLWRYGPWDFSMAIPRRPEGIRVWDRYVTFNEEPSNGR